MVALITLTSISESFGQVITRVLSPEDKIENYIPWYNPEDEVLIVDAPAVDVEEVLQQDQEEGRLLSRFSVNQETNISIDDGEIIQRSNFLIWNMALVSEGAKSVGIRFENTYLPDNAVMFMYNQESRFIVGPISSEDFTNGSFRSDFIDGNMAVVSIFVPSHDKPNININSYDYGIVNTSFNTGTFGLSEPCNINVACEEGDGWECQINSVCRIISDENRNCTGTITNNDCCDLTSYVLTANHCADGDLNDYLFRFNWQTAECENGDFPPSQWVTYQGAQLVANWEDTDFSLLELIQDIRPEDIISFSGWDRRDVVPNEVTMIHHPKGDVKKISFDANPAIENNDIPFTDFYGDTVFTIPGDHGFRITMNEFVQGDFGILEGGSSGCGYFNQNGRLVSQHAGGAPHDCEDEFVKRSGRISESWEGNGTPNSGLRDWLGSSENPNTFDCMDHPFVDGPEVLCTDPETFTLINNMPCVKDDVQWEVSASNLLASPASGFGNSATLWAKPNVKGSATITFTLTSNDGCDPIEIEEVFWIGEPNFDLYSNGPTQPCLGDIVRVYALPIPDDQDLQIIDWEVTGCGQLLSVSGNSAIIEAVNCLGWMQVCATAINECGTHQICTNINIKRCDGNEDGPINPRGITEDESSGNMQISIFPNPASDFIEVVCLDYIPGTRIAASLISTDGKVVKTIREYSHNFKVDMSDLPSGLYVLQLNVRGTIYHEKIVKL